MNISAFDRFDKVTIVCKIKQEICWLIFFELPLQKTMSNASYTAFTLTNFAFALTNLFNTTFALSPN